MISEEREALRLDPNNAMAHAKVGVALMQKGDEHGALEEFRAAYLLDPKNYKESYEDLLRQMNQ
jgi:Flp pilus assembly protein TadD